MYTTHPLLDTFYAVLNSGFYDKKRFKLTKGLRDMLQVLLPKVHSMYRS